MCRISEEIYNEGVEKGARDALFRSVRSLTESVGWTAQQALDKLKVPESERPGIIAML